MRVIALLAVATALVGCGVYHWHKDGADSAAFRSDSTACQQQSGAPAQQESGSAKPQVGPWEACMNARGWVYSSGW